MTHDPHAALAAAVSATHAALLALPTAQPMHRPAPAADENAAPQPATPDATALAREVSRLIARDIRERRAWP